jgi:thioesterase domain-containing protein
LTYIVERARALNILPSEVDVAQFRHLFHVYKANLQAMERYKPQRYTRRMTLLRASEELHRSFGDHTLGWGEVAAGPITIEIVPGSHYTMLTPPHVQVVAERLGRFLDAAQQPD